MNSCKDNPVNPWRTIKERSMRRGVLYLLMLILITSGCKSDADVLVTYDGGEINRGEFYQWLAKRNLSIRNFLKKKDLQVRELKRMAADRIAIIEAKKENFDSSERFQFLLEDIKSRYLGTLLLEQIIRQTGYREKAVKVRHIVFKTNTASEKKVLELARSVIQRLEKEPFESLAREFSEDATRGKGGEFGYIIEGIFPREYTEAAFSLAKGEYSKVPLHLKKRKRVFIIKCEEIAELTPENIESVLANPKIIASYKKIIFRKLRTAFIEKLKNSPDTAYHGERLFLNDNSATVFTIGNTHYSVAQIKKRIETINAFSPVPSKSTPRKIQMRIAERFYISELLKREALKRGIDTIPEFKQRIQFAHDIYLAGDYMEYLIRSKITATPSEIRDEYNRNKERLYYTYRMRGTKRVKVPKPFMEIKDDIERKILNLKGVRVKSMWTNKMLDLYNVTINESELETE
jgi:parvulin-like peptidyl-prolyl isomerase